MQSPGASSARFGFPGVRLVEGRPAERFVVLMLGVVMVLNGIVVGALPAVHTSLTQAAASEVGLFLSTIMAGLVLLWLGRQVNAWQGARWLAVGVWVAAGFQAAEWISRSVTGRPDVGATLPLSMAAILVGMLAAATVDFLGHIGDQRVEGLADIAMVAILTGAVVYVLPNSAGPATRSPSSLALTAVLVIGAVGVVAGWGVLCMWCPTGVHAGLLATGASMAASAIVLDRARHAAAASSMVGGPVVSATLSLLCMTAILVVEPSLNAGRTPAPYGRPWLRPALLGLSMGGACVIVAVALLSPERRLSTSEGIVLAAVVFGAAGFRMLMNQLTTERTAARLAVALREREEAVASIRHAAENVSISEARLRLLLGAAVDGMVELDGLGTVVRANRAFCAMVRLPEKEVIGRRWTEMVERAGAGSSLADLPQTGEAVLVLPAGTLHLEARSSRLPGTPPGTLLLIRDVTANKTSEQTIRTLLHFLQDRDEDRTRLLSRSNAAIEAERNRIARDLHDGPIQGISATALSLEALRMMIEAGDPDRALGTLKEIAAEIGEEAVNLRRIMSDLRPPVLEERGLIPAVRELCSRVRRETGIIVELTGSPSTAASRDLETLAYRVVQEALSNVSKHSGAKHVMVRIAVGMGIVEVVVEDDGWGFDAGGAREFLRTGKVGLASMRERTELAGGSFSIRSTPGGGTVVTASIPFDPLASGSPMAELGDSLAGLPTGVEPKEESLAEYSSRMSDDDWDFRSRDSTRPRPREDDQSKVVVVPGTRGSDEAMGSARRPIAPESG